jgi:hypothetical protein
MNGEVACPDHAPQFGDPRWIAEGWAPLKVLSGVVQGALYQYQCQHCAADGAAVEREARLADILDRIRGHNEKAYYSQQRGEYLQREGVRRAELAKRKSATGSPGRRKRG